LNIRRLLHKFGTHSSKLNSDAADYAANESGAAGKCTDFRIETAELPRRSFGLPVQPAHAAWCITADIGKLPPDALKLRIRLIVEPNG
jgi:hypothetical protein